MSTPKEVFLKDGIYYGNMINVKGKHDDRALIMHEGRSVFGSFEQQNKFKSNENILMFIQNEGVFYGHAQHYRSRDKSESEQVLIGFFCQTKTQDMFFVEEKQEKFIENQELSFEQETPNHHNEKNNQIQSVYFQKQLHDIYQENSKESYNVFQTSKILDKIITQLIKENCKKEEMRNYLSHESITLYNQLQSASIEKWNVNSPKISDVPQMSNFLLQNDLAYVGFAKNQNNPHGLGIVYNTQSLDVIISGQFEDGILHGFGYIKIINEKECAMSDITVGQFKKGSLDEDCIYYNGTRNSYIFGEYKQNEQVKNHQAGEGYPYQLIKFIGKKYCESKINFFDKSVHQLIESTQLDAIKYVIAQQFNNENIINLIFQQNCQFKTINGKRIKKQSSNTNLNKTYKAVDLSQKLIKQNIYISDDKQMTYFPTKFKQIQIKKAKKSDLQETVKKEEQQTNQQNSIRNKKSIYNRILQKQTIQKKNMLSIKQTFADDTLQFQQIKSDEQQAEQNINSNTHQDNILQKQKLDDFISIKNIENESISNSKLINIRNETENANIQQQQQNIEIQKIQYKTIQNTNPINHDQQQQKELNVYHSPANNSKQSSMDMQIQCTPTQFDTATQMTGRSLSSYNQGNQLSGQGKEQQLCEERLLKKINLKQELTSSYNKHNKIQEKQEIISPLINKKFQNQDSSNLQQIRELDKQIMALLTSNKNSTQQEKQKKDIIQTKPFFVNEPKKQIIVQQNAFLTILDELDKLPTSQRQQTHSIFGNDKIQNQIRSNNEHNKQSLKLLMLPFNNNDENEKENQTANFYETNQVEPYQILPNNNADQFQQKCSFTSLDFEFNNQSSTQCCNNKNNSSQTGRGEMSSDMLSLWSQFVTKQQVSPKTYILHQPAKTNYEL